MTTDLHIERIEAVARVARETGSHTLLDLGCGTGDLIMRLAPLAQFTLITGLDIDIDALRLFRNRLDNLPDDARAKVQLAHATMTKGHPKLRGYDCACLVETIEHLPLADLNRLERALFVEMRPRHVVLTTPNSDFNPLLGVPTRRFRHPDHQFEWSRAQFSRWAAGVAERNGYTSRLGNIGHEVPGFGSPSQMAIFERDR